MPRFAPPTDQQTRLELIRARRAYERSPLMIATPVVEDEALRKKWHGVPPTKRVVTKRSGGTIAF